MRYIFLFLVIILFLVLGIAVVTNRGRGTPSNLPKKVLTADFANKSSSKVSLTTQGRLVGQDQRRAIKIEVTPTQRTIYLLNGYEENIQQSKTYPNSQAAYESFLKTLDYNNFGRQRVFNKDEKGFCPLGRRFVYELRDSGINQLRSWSDSCSTKEGTFAGSAGKVQKIFQLQISDYPTFIKNVRL